MELTAEPNEQKVKRIHARCTSRLHRLPSRLKRGAKCRRAQHDKGKPGLGGRRRKSEGVESQRLDTVIDGGGLGRGLVVAEEEKRLRGEGGRNAAQKRKVGEGGEEGQDGRRSKTGGGE